MNTPFSPDARHKFGWNIVGLLTFLVLPYLLALWLHSTLDDHGVFDGLYPATISANYSSPGDNPSEWSWGTDTNGPHSLFRNYGGERKGLFASIQETGHFEAHIGKEIWNDGYMHRTGGKTIPAEESRIFWCEHLFLTALFLLTPIGIQHFLPRSLRILAANRKDFQWAKRLRQGIFAESDPFASYQGTAEPAISGAWRPLDKFIAANQTFVPRDFGQSLSFNDLNQLSVLLWMTNGERIIRVKLPNDAWIRQVIADAVESWLTAKPAMDWDRTHVGKAIEEYRFCGDSPRPTPALNEIVKDIGEPFEKRRPVELYGQFETDDLLLATGITVQGWNGPRHQIVIPTGYFQRVLEEVKDITGEELLPLQLQKQVAA
jgi:hypothetical protein